MMLLLAISLLFLSTGCDDLYELCDIQEDDLQFVETFNEQLNQGVFIYQISDKALRSEELKTNFAAIIDSAVCTLVNDSIIINYGLGTFSPDGKLRKGSIRMRFEGDYLETGGNAALKLFSYSVNDENYTGDFGISNISTPGGNPTISLDMIDFTRDTSSIAGTVNVEWLSGFFTFDSINDDRYQFNGSLDMGSTVSGFLLNSVVNQSIIIDQACDVLFESGILTLSLAGENASAIIIDFIDGDCDNLFQCTFDCNGNPTSFFYPIK
jgi:hypothetical protein